MSFAFAYGSRLVSQKFAIVGVERMMVHGSRAIWIGYNCWVFDFMYVVKATANSLHALHGGLPLAHQQFLYDNLTVTTSAVRGSRNMLFAIDIWRNNNEKKMHFRWVIGRSDIRQWNMCFQLCDLKARVRRYFSQSALVNRAWCGCCYITTSIQNWMKSEPVSSE